MPGAVQLFVTCLVDGFRPEVGIATVSILESLGYTVEFPLDQTCCGQPALNAGYREQASEMARHTVEVLDSTVGPIILPSGSCTEMVIHHAPGLLAGTDLEAAAHRVAERTRELTQFLVDDAGVESVPSTAKGQVTYHSSCHGLRGLGLRTQSQQLLDGCPGLERTELEGSDECCGFGGLFSIELPEVSAAMLESKIDRILETGATTVVGSDLSCLMHIAGGLHRQGIDIDARHVAEVLAEGMDP